MLSNMLIFQDLSALISENMANS